MSAIKLRQLLSLLVIAMCVGAQLTSGQVTFSKGWGPGKRAAALDNEPECRINAKSLALIFRSLVAELKRSMACDLQAAVNYLQAAPIGQH